MTIYGYARVSSKGQDLKLQIEQLMNNGVPMDLIFSEKFTGTTTNRPEFKKLIELLHPHDVLVVTKLDRFARTVSEGIELINDLTVKGIKVHVLNIGLLDDSTAGKLLRNILLAFAEFERDMIVERVQEGKAKARLKPDYREGRPKRVITEEYRNAYELLNDHTYDEVAKITGISRTTLFRIKKQINGE